jgi:hypothetical protein
LAAERADLAADAEKETDENALPPTTITEPKQDQVTLPPPPKTDESAAPQPKSESATPKVEAPPPVQTRPREVEPAKKKGKKGDGEG